MYLTKNKVDSLVAKLPEGLSKKELIKIIGEEYTKDQIERIFIRYKYLNCQKCQ